jgi:hypothetical protein
MNSLSSESTFYCLFFLLPWSSAVSPKDSFQFLGSERRPMNQIQSFCVDLPQVCILNLKFFSNRHLAPFPLDKYFGFFHPKTSSFSHLKIVYYMYREPFQILILNFADNMLFQWQGITLAKLYPPNFVNSA